jgi:hypothetical protein
MLGRRCAVWDLLVRESRHLVIQRGSHLGKRVLRGRKKMFGLDVEGEFRWRVILGGY